MAQSESTRGEQSGSANLNETECFINKKDGQIAASGEKKGESRVQNGSSVKRDASRGSVHKKSSKRVKVRSHATTTDKETERKQLRESIKFMFQSPCERFRENKRINKKLLLQLVQVLFITALMAIFHSERENFENYLQTSRVTFHHIFLKDWNEDLEVLPYPPASGEYAMYTREELFGHMNYVLQQLHRFDKLALSTLRVDSRHPVTLDIQYIKKISFDQHMGSYDVDSNTTNVHIELPYNRGDKHCSEDGKLEDCFQIQDYLRERNQSIDVNRIVDMTMNLKLKGVNVQPFVDHSAIPLSVSCVTFNVKIMYDNSKGSGQFLVKLNTDLDMKYCDETEANADNSQINKRNKALHSWLIIYDVVVLVMCTVTFFLGCHTIVHRTRLLMKTKKLFQDHYGYSLTWPEKSEFITLWIFQHMFTDILVISGTAIKLYLKFGNVAYAETFGNQRFYNAAAILLGFGNMSQWFGLIRYIAYFDQFYILVLTITKAIPALIRFLICGLTMFVGYLFAGWIILGPYNPKFQTLTNSALSLFSLITGDEIYATMSIINYQDHSTEIWLFSRVYLYSYIPLFIFAVANLFIAVIMESYESLQQSTGYDETFLRHFYKNTLDEVDCAEELEDDSDVCDLEKKYGICAPLICWRKPCPRDNESSDEQGVVELNAHTDDSQDTPRDTSTVV